MDTRIIGNGFATPQTQPASTVGGTNRNEGLQNTRGSETTVETAQSGDALTEPGVIVTLSEEDESPGKTEEEKFKTKEEMELESLQRMVDRMREAKKSKKKTDAVKKRLNYTYRKVSGKISAAKTVRQAGSALTSANNNLSLLRRKSASGKYDESEIQIAMVHAKKMVRTAKKKLKNVKNESQMEKQDQMTVNVKEIRSQKILMKRAREKAEQKIEEMEKELENIRKQYKRSNRTDENMELMNADMEYLRRKIELMKAGKGDMAVSMNNSQEQQEALANAVSETLAGQASAEQAAMAVEAASAETAAAAPMQ